MSSNKERKKILTDKQQAIVDIVVTAIEALVVVVCIVVSVLVWVGASDPIERNFNWFAIQTDSMMGSNPDSLNPGDLMFAKRVKSIGDLHVGDVVAFKGTIIDTAGNAIEDQIITHRVTRIEGNKIWTRGDNTVGDDQAYKGFEDIIGRYSGKWKGVGKVTLWLGGYKKVVTDQERFDNPDKLGGYGYERSGNTATFLVIIIPLALLFIYNGYVVVKWAMDERAKKIRAAAMAEAEQNMQQTEDQQRQAMVQFMRANGMTDQQIEEFFAQQQAAKEAQEAQPAEGESADTADEGKPDADTDDSEGTDN